MFSNIMIPVDLAHADKLGHALKCAADLAGLYGATVTYVGVSAATPSSVAHSPQEFAEKLKAFAETEAGKHGHKATAHAMTSHDPSTDLDPTLLKAVDETGADLWSWQATFPTSPTTSGLPTAGRSRHMRRSRCWWCADDPHKR